MYRGKYTALKKKAWLPLLNISAGLCTDKQHPVSNSPPHYDAHSAY